MSIKFDIKNYIPGKIVCVGMNYKSHMKENDGFFPRKPVLFSKARTCIIKDGESIKCPNEVEQLDYEVELAVIIGKKIKNIPPEDIYDYIYGYTIINDITSRDLQKKETQWYRAKSIDTFGPIGPAIMPKKYIDNPNDLYIRSFVNKEIRQDSNTSDMFLDVFKLLSYISQSITLDAGDLIATGTPAGIGLFREDKKFLEDGDEVICEIEKIGQLKNRVKKINGKKD